MTRLSTPLLVTIARCVEAAYPSEGCGLVLRDGAGRLHVEVSENIADKLHAEDPRLFPATGRSAYIIDPQVFIDAERRGEAVVGIYHSHCDVGDAFSAADRRAAVVGRDESSGPSWPGMTYIVVAVNNGIAARATGYRYSEATRRFEASERYDALTS